MTVAEDANLTALTLAIYEDFDDQNTNTAYRYPEAWQMIPARFVVYGSVHCTGSFGGKFYAASEGKVTCATDGVTVYEPQSYTGSGVNTKVNTDALWEATLQKTHAGAIAETTVTLDSNGGSAVSNLTLPIGTTTYPILPIPTKDDHIFLGWYYNGALVRHGDALKAEASHSLTAMWKSTPTNIALDANGDGTVDSYFETSTPLYPSLPSLTKPGYVFLGWYYGNTRVQADELLKTAENHMLTAKFQAGTVTVTLTGEGVTNTSILLPANGTYPVLSAPNYTKDGYRFIGWALSDGTIVKAGEAVRAGDHTLTATYAVLYNVGGNRVNIITGYFADGISDATIEKAVAGQDVAVALSFKNESGRSVTVKDANDNDVSFTQSNTTIYFKMPASNVTITVKSDSSCFTPDTLITLADGTQKRIDEVEYTDMILVWNFSEGRYDAAPASIIMNHGYGTVDVLTLVFADGTRVNTINGHGFFDEALNQFVIIDTENVADYVGHSFIKLDGDSYSATELVGYSVETRYTEVWSILTAVHYNAIIEGMWSVTEAEVPNSPTYLMPFVVGEDMKYDNELMQADIEKYGLYTYEEFAEYCTREQFEALGLDIFKVAVGKGYITREQIIFLLELHCS